MPAATALGLLPALWASEDPAPIVLDIDWRTFGARARAVARLERVALAAASGDAADFLNLIQGLSEPDARDVVAELIA